MIRRLPALLSLSFLLFSLNILTLSQTSGNPAGGHLVGTIIGVPDTGPIGGFRTDARFMTVSDFGFLPNGDMLIADSGQDRVFRIGPDGIVRLFAGNGLRAQFDENVPAGETPLPRPGPMAMDGAGNTYVAVTPPPASKYANYIRRIAPDGKVTTIAGNGQEGCPEDGALATQSPIALLRTLAAAPDGTLYFTAANCVLLYRLDLNGRIGVAAGSPEGYTHGWPLPQSAAPAGEIQIVSVRAVVVDNSAELVVGFVDRTVRINREAVAMRIAGSADGSINDRQGDVNRVWFGGLVSAAALFDGSIAVSFDTADGLRPTGSEIGLISPDGTYRILASRDGFAGTRRLTFNDSPIRPTHVRADALGNLYFLDVTTGVIFRLPESGAPVAFAGAFPRNPEYSLTAIPPVFRGFFQTNPAADAMGNLYFTAVSKLFRMAPNGAITHIAGSGAFTGSPDGTPPLEANLSFSGYLGIDGQSNLYWQDANALFRRLSPQGALTTVLGGGTGYGFVEGQRGTSLGFPINRPTLIGVSALGECFFWWPKNSQNPIPSIWKVGTDGIATRFAGTSDLTETLIAEGAPARNVDMFDASPMSVSPDGSVYVAFRLRPDLGIFRIDPQGVLRQVARGNNNMNVANGEPTATASNYIVSTFYGESANQLLLSASVAGHLARYTSGATVTILRDADAGYSRRDGDFLRNDRLVQAKEFTSLPDGGFAWVETHGESRVLRRSFPIPATCAGQYSPGFTEFTAGGAGGRVTLPLTTGPACPWTAGTSSNWIEITGARFGTGPVNLELRYKPNPSPLPRTASVWIAGKEVTIHQQPSTAQDLFYVTPTSAEIDAAGGSVEVRILASPGLAWAVSLPPQVPVQIEGNSAGTGSATFRLRMDALPSGMAERTARLGLNASTILLRQRAAAQPVPFTISSTLPNDKATIDLVERPLPYTAQWLPGSSHHVRFLPYRAIAERTVSQLIKLGDVPWASTRTVRTPAAGSGLLAEYRTLHFAELRSEASGTLGAVGLVFEYLSEPVPNEFFPQGASGSTITGWFPAGSTVGVLATEGHGVKFTGFSGALEGTNNPASLRITGPVTAIANGTYAMVPPSPYLVTSTPPFQFYGESRAANPWPIAVGFASQPAPEPVPTLFLSRGIRIGEKDWLALRRPSTMPPFTLEAQILPDGAATVIGPERPSRIAQLYLHRPGYAPLVRTLSAELEPVSTSGQPWIAAVTDGGGFRQFPTNTNTFNADSPAFAPGMIVSLFGANFSTATASADTVPLPAELAGTRVEVRAAGSAGWVAVPLFYVSPSQINFQIPPTVTEGSIDVRVVRGQTESMSHPSLLVRSRSASLFSADSSGNGAAAGSYVRVLPDATQQRGDLFRCDDAGCTVNRIAFGGAQNQLFLEIYGTGFHNAGLPDSLRVYLGDREVPVEFAGPHAAFVGLDQLNIKVPSSIARNTDLDLYLWVRNGDGAWLASNRLTLRFE